MTHYTAGSVTAITDRNGNTIHFNGFCPDGSPCTETITDDLNRAITLTTGTGEQDQITWPGPPNSPTLTAYVNWANDPISSGLGYNCVFDGNGGLAPSTVPGGNRCNLAVPNPVISSIELPTDTTGAPSNSGASQWQYTFGYSTPSTGCASGGAPNSWGELHSVTVPSGAQAQYTYRWDCGTGRTAEIIVNPLVTRQHIYSEIRDNTTTPITETTTYYGYAATDGNGAESKVVQTNPDGTSTTYCLASPPGITYPGGRIYKQINPDGSVVDRIWLANPNPVVNQNPNNAGAPTTANPYLAGEATTVVDASGNLASTSARAYVVDKNGNNLETDEYDWSAASTSRQCTPSGLMTTIPGTLKRSTLNTWYASTPAATTGYADTTYGYWNQSPATNLRTKKSTTVCNGAASNLSCAPGYVAQTQYDYDYGNGRLTTGNLTSEQRWDNAPNGTGYVTSTWDYDTNPSYNTCGTPHGNLARVVDPNSFATHTYYDGNCLYPTKQVVAEGASEARTTTYSYDSGSGLLESKTDTDNSNVKTTYTYDDIGRETLEVQTDSADSITRQKQTQYDDLNLIETVKQDPDLTATTYYDPLGRVRLVDNGVGLVQKAYRYGNGVSYELDSNPYAENSTSNNGDSTMGWTLTTRDSMNRVTSVAHYAGGEPPANLSAPPNPTPPNTNAPPYPTPVAQAAPSPWCSGQCGTATGTVQTQYSGATSTVTDEAGISHTNTVDGLGRLTSVQEANGNTTTYAYDLLNNLTGVSMPNQGVTQQRSFTYSSLSRLLTATNKESGQISYGYDARGNLIQRTDANNTIMCVGDGPSGGTCPGTSAAANGAPAYDGLSRPRAKNYSIGAFAAATPSVQYVYDQDTKGTLYSVASGNNSTVYTHDKLGRVTGSTQSTAGTTFQPFVYTYSLSDKLTSMKYPSGRTVTYTYDIADRPITVTGASPSAYYTASGQQVSYKPAGVFSSIPLGNGVTETYSWNDRLQQTGIQASGSQGSLSLSFFPCDGGLTQCSNNNGNIWRDVVQSSGMTGTATQEYRYDNLNRLTFAVENGTGPFTSTSACSGSVGGSWCQQFNYDQAGNLTVAGQTGITLATVSSISPTTNRITDTGWAYDSNGNIIASPSGQPINYDAENRQVNYTPTGSTQTTYVYDGEGRRVQKIESSATSTYVYDVSGELAAEYTTGALTVSGTQYLTTDHLGSTRMVTGGLGSPSGQTVFHDYQPFGYEILAGISGRSASYGETDNPRQKFTGKERDAETGLDYFGARYFSSAQGRFTSPDWSAAPEPVAYANLGDPQTLNLYAYVRNNPLSRPDLDGHSDYIPQKLKNFLSGKGWKTNAQVKGLSVAQTAKSHVGSMDWAINTSNSSGKDIGHPQNFKNPSNKCNEFVGDTLAEAGKTRPEVPDGKGGTRMPNAHELADPKVHIPGLSGPKPLSEAQPGDVIAQAHGDFGHSGIVVAPGQTASVNTAGSYGGQITQNDWGFRPAGQNGESNTDSAPVVRTAQ